MMLFNCGGRVKAHIPQSFWEESSGFASQNLQSLQAFIASSPVCLIMQIVVLAYGKTILRRVGAFVFYALAYMIAGFEEITAVVSTAARRSSSDFF